MALTARDPTASIVTTSQRRRKHSRSTTLPILTSVLPCHVSFLARRCAPCFACGLVCDGVNSSDPAALIVAASRQSRIRSRTVYLQRRRFRTRGWRIVGVLYPNTRTHLRAKLLARVGRHCLESSRHRPQRPAHDREPSTYPAVRNFDVFKPPVGPDPQTRHVGHRRPFPTAPATRFSQGTRDGIRRDIRVPQFASDLPNAPLGPVTCEVARIRSPRAHILTLRSPPLFLRYADCFHDRITSSSDRAVPRDDLTV
jgi:hypothetical protein